jgi:hypothetical protein
VVERCVAVPGRRCELLVPPTKLAERRVTAVGDDEPSPRELEGCSRIADGLDADPTICRNREQKRELPPVEKTLLAFQNGDGE